MRARLILASILLCWTTASPAQLSVNIGVNVPVYPELVPVPGYPVYYAPGLNSNYFFYDGMYWVFQGDGWYSSAWYNGPWNPVDPEFVPLYVLRVPVRYYRRPPTFFVGWGRDASPRWGEHWGRGWEEHHSGWDHWDRHAAPRAAPLPSYQRQFSGSRYPQAGQQQALQGQHYHYQANDPAVREHMQQPGAPRPAASQGFAQQHTPQQPSAGQDRPQRTQPGNASPFQEKGAAGRAGESQRNGNSMKPQTQGQPGAQPKPPGAANQAPQSQQKNMQGPGAQPHQAQPQQQHAPQAQQQHAPQAQPQHAPPKVQEKEHPKN